MKLKLLKKTELTKALKNLDEWKLNPKGTTLTLVRTFPNHIDALVFIARATVHAQVLAHHPDILFTFQKVKVTLTTHESGGITKLDTELAKRISHIEKRGG